MKAKKIISLILLILMISVLGGILYTNSKYVSSANGSITADVAKYVFKVSAKDSFDEAHTLENLVLASTCNPKTLTNGKIAPGTSGSFDIVLDATGSDVAVNYNVTFTNTSGHTLPQNIILKLDGQAWSFEDGISDTIYLDSASKMVTHKITWEWPYETKDEQNSVVAGDLMDTTAGTSGFDYSFTVTAIGTQALPNA